MFTLATGMMTTQQDGLHQLSHKSAMLTIQRTESSGLKTLTSCKLSPHSLSPTSPTHTLTATRKSFQMFREPLLISHSLPQLQAICILDLNSMHKECMPTIARMAPAHMELWSSTPAEALSSPVKLSMGC
jgi:hypothetical protein